MSEFFSMQYNKSVLFTDLCAMRILIIFQNFVDDYESAMMDKIFLFFNARPNSDLI